MSEPSPPPLEPLDEATQALLEAERDFRPEDGNAESVWSAVQTSIGAGATGHPPRPRSFGPLGVAAGFVLGVGVGAIAMWAAIGSPRSDPQPAAPAGPRVERPPEGSTPSLGSRAVIEELDAGPPLDTAAPPTSRRRDAGPRLGTRDAGAPDAGAAPPAPRTSLEMDGVSERQIIDRARNALARRRPADALVALTLHEEHFPHGEFVEDREALLVMTLWRMGRADDARLRLAQFRAAYPSSLHAPAIQRVMAEP